MARVVFRPTGRFRGDMALFYDDVPVGKGTMPLTTPISFGVEGFTVGHQRGSPIAPECPGRLAVPDGLVVQVVIDADGKPYRDPDAEARVGLAQQ